MIQKKEKLRKIAKQLEENAIANLNLANQLREVIDEETSVMLDKDKFAQALSDLSTKREKSRSYTKRSV